MNNNKVMSVRGIYETSYENGTCWVEYTVGNESMDSSSHLVGYEISSVAKRDSDKEGLTEMINGIPNLLKKFVDKKRVEEACSPFLAGLIIECLQSENEMWYVDYEEMSDSEITQKMLDDLSTEVCKLGIQDCVSVDDGEYAICVYGDVTTVFLF